MMDLNKLIRPHIFSLAPYSTARDEYKGALGIFLDANENSFGSITQEKYNRYPDPYQWSLKEKISEIKSVEKENILLGNGSDEVIDLLFRLFCQPGKDNVIILPPTYGMYEVSAAINDVALQKVFLTPDFQIDVEAVLAAVNPDTKMIWICSPNNPSGNLLNPDHILKIIKPFPGIVVVDEAYIDFSPSESLTARLNECPNLVVIQTFSKAWGMAALRLGMAFASREIIYYLNKIKPPYNINYLTQKTVLEALESASLKDKMVAQILEQKRFLIENLEKLEVVEKIYPSDANFVLVKMASDAKRIYDYLVANEVIVRDRSRVKLCEGCLRISIGTEDENKILLKKLKDYSF